MLTPRRGRFRCGANAPIALNLNAVETFAPFAALVLIAHVSGKANAMTAFWAMSFFWLRLAHAVIYLLAVPYVRTLVFTLGFVAVAGIFWELIN
jgi:uncharacterized MAPEG superfamily protein